MKYYFFVYFKDPVALGRQCVIVGPIFFNLFSLGGEMIYKYLSARGLLLGIFAAGGLTVNSDFVTSLTERESQAILSLMSTLDNHTIQNIIEASQVRDLSDNEEKIIDSIHERGTQMLVAGPQPMY